jgi:fibro-slime domain-containing protein
MPSKRFCDTVLTILALAVVGCGGGDDAAAPAPDPGTDPSGAGGSPFIDIGSGSGGSAGNPCTLDDGTDCDWATNMDPACGDGAVDEGEQCDDGNGRPGDGCTGVCTVEPHFACAVAGEPCVSTIACGNSKKEPGESCDDGGIVAGDGCSATCRSERATMAVCGDGQRTAGEQCDDGGTAPGDGCDATCRVEATIDVGKLPSGANPLLWSWDCEPGQPCTVKRCGDQDVAGTEQCDDGNNDMGDGCTPTCRKEPSCRTAEGQSTACVSSCGDGLILPGDLEQCDDGNLQDGDGCSSSCTPEAGFACQLVSGAVGEQLVVPIVYRDFRAFDEALGPKSSRHPDFQQYNGGCKDIVQNSLDVDGKPVLKSTKGSCNAVKVTSTATFAQWYRDAMTTGGERINKTVIDTLTLQGTSTAGEFRFYDAEFFPLTGRGWDAETPALETLHATADSKTLSNFFFTSEVRYWFQYEGGEKLEFKGDDDVWVFVNGRLAVDLGGIHDEETGSVTLGTAADPANTFGLEAGRVYEIVVFQAERHTSRSQYQLTLSGFNVPKSECKTQCGDGVATYDEECDEGEANVAASGYGQCTTECVRGPYCGDGVKQAQEECDDGLLAGGYGQCGAGCKIDSYCGDGVKQAEEECDDGVLAGGYGQCGAGCVVQAICGDGVVQAPHENCDDGNLTSNDGCSATCSGEVKTPR